MKTNAVMLQGFEWYLPDDGNYYRWMKSKVYELKEAGFDGIWLPPMCKATGTNDVGYGIYDLYDLGEFDQKGGKRTKYGTFEELKELIEELHKQGIMVYADVILNHKAGADREEEFMAVPVDPNDRTKEIGEARNIKGWTGFDFPGRNGEYSQFVWYFDHFNGVDYDGITGENGIYKIIGNGKNWESGVSTEKGNFDYLMFADIDHNHPDVRNELFQWGKWLIKKTDVDGIRFDALKHINDKFIEEFRNFVDKSTDKKMYYFGEYWIYDEAQTNRYLYETKYNVDLFDVGLHFNMQQASINSSGYDLRKIFDNTVVAEHPSLAVTFVDNHDSEPGQALESFVQPWFKESAYALILLRKDGFPCVFYGDYYGIGGNFNIAGEKDKIDRLIWIRKKLAYGEQNDYMDSPQMIGWVRQGTKEYPKKLAVVISTGNMNTLSMFVGESEAGKIYIDYTGNNTNEIMIKEDGFGDFQVGPGSISAWSEK